jgi:nicotinamide phosphoribosyltransferase
MTSKRRNFAIKTDGYKPSHHLFYAPGVKRTYDYLESRGGEYGDTTFFGLQAHIMKYLTGSVITVEEVEEARRFYKKYFGMDGVFNYDGWMYIAKELGGRLPIAISALPEGTTVPVRTPLMVYWNTDPKCAWLPGYLEPLMFKMWNPITIATLSRHCKKVLWDGLVKTGNEADIVWKLHDFGYRGVSSEESAEVGGAAHLLNFYGTDTIPAIQFIHEFYGDGKFDEFGDPIYMPGFSVRATEHSVMTQLGREGEEEIVRNILKVCPDGIVAMVADSYDTYNFAEKILGHDLHTEVVNRNGLVVVRPDSGDPIPVMMKLLWILGEKFGWEENSKGYRVLKHVRTLQGDRNDYNAIYNMVRAVTGARWSLDNIAAFGMGGALLQASTRDTQKMAIKLSAIMMEDGKWKGVSKDPVTDAGKGSKPGRFIVVCENGRFVTKTIDEDAGVSEFDENNILRPVFKNGEMLVHDNFEEVRARANGWKS